MAFVRLTDSYAVVDDETGLCLENQAQDRERTWWRLSLGLDVISFTAQSDVIPSPDPSAVDRTYLFKVDGPYGSDLRLGVDRSHDAIRRRIEQALRGWVETSPANRGLYLSVMFEHAC
jgi:hypothetical protein